MKLALVLYAARMLARPRQRSRSLRDMGGPLVVVAAGACGLVALQPDLGTAMVIGFTVAAVLIAAGVPLRQLGAIALGVAVVIGLYALLEPYRRARLTSFLNPWADPGGRGFQSVQGQIALGSGGLFGVGLGRSVQKIFYLPEAHTDFILAVVGEELGVMGICGLLFLYGMILYAGLRTAKAAVGRYAKLLATGITSLILCQAILNVFTVLGLAPLTGVPLPFVSSGSSNLLILLASMGLLLNVACGGTLAARRPARSRSPGRRSDAGAHEDRDRRGRDGRARRAGADGRRHASG
jgi:cell division protein FtsW